MRREALIVARVCASLKEERMVLSEFICVHLWFHEFFWAHDFPLLAAR
jgi:hypothetical protein